MRALELVSWWPVDAAAAGVVRRTDTPGDIPGPSPTVVDSIGEIEQVFAWASISKLLVAMAVLVGVEE